MSDVLQFLLSGPGLIGGQHARLVDSRADSKLACIVAPPNEENERFAQDHGIPRYDGIELAVAELEIDAAIISSPNEFHFDQAIACIANGVPTLVEKPVTDNIDDALALADRAERSGVPVLVGHHRTYSPLLDAADAFMQSANFGRLVTVQGTALFYKPSHYFEEGIWRTKIGGGPILINLIHEIGLMRHFCGEITRVSAIASRSIRHFEVEDTVAISFEFENGALGTFLLSDTAASNKSWEMTSGENPTYPNFPEDNCYHFAGTRGSLDFPSMAVRYYEPSVEPSWWNEFTSDRLKLKRADPLERQLEHFVEVIRGKAEPKVSARDGYRNMLVVEAISQSLAEGKVVELAST